jgi:uncharacterized integral membrane protein
MAERDERAEHPQDFPPTKTSRAWWTLGGGLLLLLLAIIFIAQNGDEVEVRFLWMSGRLALGVALFAAAIMGGLTVLLLGATRVLHLRRLAKRARESPRSE